MSDLDLDRRCAEIMGWTHTRTGNGWASGSKPETPSINSEIPNYSTSLDACRELLEWAMQQQYNQDDKVFKFNYALSDMVIRSDHTRTIQLLLATPRQICEAFVECFGVGK